jgi:molybdopterin synthase sulfur carrier subunit
MVSVTVKAFGPLKDLLQNDELRIEVPSPCKGETAFEVLVARHPQLQQWKTSVRLAVNLEYASFNHILKHNDEISFIPPVSGG